MNSKKTNKILFALFLPVLFFFQFFSANAEEANIKEELRLGRGITMSPVTFELTANPGDRITNAIKISNPTENSVGVKMETEDFVAVGEEGKVVVMDEENETYSLKKWIKTNPENFVLGAGEARLVEFLINVPQNAEPGGHYASVLAVVASSDNPESGSAVSQKVGALVLLSVSGEVKEDLLVKEFSAPKFSEKGPILFTIRFENTGSVHSRPRGFVSVMDMNGKKVADLAFEQKNILPGAVRKLEVTLDKKFLFGKYQADLIGNYGANTNKPIEATIEFWVIPWKIVLVCLLALFVIYLIRRRLFLMLRVLIKGA